VTDQIQLRGLRLVAVVGLLPEERERAQPLEVDLDVEVDLTAAGLSDDLADSVDYGAICDAVAATARDAAPLLLERLAALLARAVLLVDDRIAGVSVAVRKLRPPVPHDLTTSGVRVHRTRAALDAPDPTLPTP
jgi:dihydroneopterin aldolase